MRNADADNMRFVSFRRCVTCLPGLGHALYASPAQKHRPQTPTWQEISMAKDNNDEKPKLKRKQYEKELLRLQVELCHLQEWVKANGLKVVVIFEGRDGAGKGGTIKAITERVSSRVFRVVALPAPSDREKSQLYIQRYVDHF